MWLIYLKHWTKILETASGHWNKHHKQCSMVRQFLWMQYILLLQVLCSETSSLNVYQYPLERFLHKNKEIFQGYSVSISISSWVLTSTFLGGSNITPGVAKSC